MATVGIPAPQSIPSEWRRFPIVVVGRVGWQTWYPWYPWYLDPDDIHAEITSWTIYIPKGRLGRDGESYNLYVDSNYIGNNKNSAERARFRGLRLGMIPCPSFEDTMPPWKPSPWRAESPAIGRRKRLAQKNNTGDDSPQTKDEKTKQ